MSTKLSVLLSGVVGVDPRLLFLSTSATESEILQPGFMNTVEDVIGIDIGPGDYIFTLYESGAKREIFIADFGPNRVITLQGIAGEGNAPGGVTGGVNLGLGEGIYAGVDGSDLEFKSLRAGSNVTLSGSGTEITISASGGGGGGGIDGAINLGTGAGVFASVSGSDLQFKSLRAGSNVTITTNSNEITIAASGSGGGNFNYEDTWFVAKNGNDANDGRSVNTPKLTLDNVLSSFTALNNVVNVLDNGTYDVNFGRNDGGALTYINAPAASFVGDGGTAFYIENGSSLIVDCYQITSDTGSGIAEQIGGIGGKLYINAKILDATGGFLYQGLDATSASSFIYINCETATADTMDFASTVVLNANSLGNTAITTNGVLPGVFYVNVDDFQGSISGDGEVTGKLGKFTGGRDVYYGTGYNLSDQTTIREIYPVEVKTSSFELQSEDSNKLFLLDEDTPNIVVRLPAYSDNPNLPIGFRAWFIQTGPVRAIFDTFDSIFTPNNYVYSSGRGALVQATLLELNGTDYVWGLSGDLAPNAGTTSVALYVSKVNGSDVDGDGTFGNPYGSITQALSVIGTPSIMTPVIVLDGETYEENVVIPEGNIALIGPEATVAGLLGDSIQITSSSGSNIINLFQIGGSGATNAISCTQTGTTAFVNVDKIEENIDVSVTGVNLSINSKELDGDIAVVSGSAVTYITNTRSGTDSGAGSISGLYPGMPVLSAPMTVIPWTSWNYFVWAGGNLAWSQSNALNGAPYSGGSADYGDADLIIPVDGNYRFSAAYITENNKAIMSITIDGVTQNIDMYSAGASGASYSWEQLLTAGTYSVNLNNLTKNPSSSDYQMLLFNNGLSVTRIGPLP